jgi:hypothetical protein
MQSMDSVQAKRGMVSGALLALMVFFVAAPVAATSANFASGGWGLDPTNLTGLPSFTIDGSVPFLDAGDPTVFNNLDVELTGSLEGDICILAAGSNVCQANLNSISGPYSALVTLQIEVINTAQISGPFTLVLSGLDGTYDPSEVSINLNPTAPAGLDTSAVSGFVFDGSFTTDFVHVEDLTNESMGDIYDYVGWTVTDLGSVTFRYDVSTAPNGRDTPGLFLNAIPVVVPEPGTALLLGLGLAGLTVAGRRAPMHDAAANAFGDDLEV